MCIRDSNNVCVIFHVAATATRPVCFSFVFEPATQIKGIRDRKEQEENDTNPSDKQLYAFQLRVIIQKKRTVTEKLGIGKYCKFYAQFVGE